MRILAPALSSLILAACTTAPPARVAEAPPPMLEEVQVLAINDFHGRLEAPKRSLTVRTADGSEARIPVGGAAYIAGALDALDADVPGEALRVAAGDMIGASPIESALFLDEPSISAIDMMDLDFSALGNHEFDKGPDELRRIDEGGCDVFTKLTPCALDGSFAGAQFTYLAANVTGEDGRTLFPAARIAEVDGHRIGVIGMPLAGVPQLVAPNLVDGLTFADEADTANALVANLTQQGAETIVMLIHEGGAIEGRWDDPECPGLSGAILPIVERLDPAISVVISGHTHQVYSCQLRMPNGAPGSRLLTSAGSYGSMVTDIRLDFDATTGVFVGARGVNVPVQGAAFRDGDGTMIEPSDGVRRFVPDAEVAALVARVSDKARPLAERVVGTLSAPVYKPDDDREGTAGYLIADSQWAATRDADTGNADLALMNPGGVRTGLDAGPITYGDVFAMQPFQNSLMTMTLSGAEIRQVIEEGLADDDRIMPALPSKQLAYSYDTSRPAGQRVIDLTYLGKPIDPAKDYRVTVNNFIAYGGDGYQTLKMGRDVTGAGIDVDALAAWLEPGRDAPDEVRVVDKTPTDR